MKHVLEVEKLVKQYGTKQALEDVSFRVQEGSCFGLLGPNGAGKSTTMKIITGVTKQTEGTAKLFGLDSGMHSSEIRLKVGYVPQELTLYEKLSATENLRFFGEMYGVRGALLKRRIGEVLEQVGLADRAKDPISTFSGGMKRRINIAAALIHKPKLVILDEPTVGIDPQSRNHIFEMIRSLQQEGVTLLYSTHYMEEVEALCDDIAIIDSGRVIAQGSLDRLLDNYAVKAVYAELGAEHRELLAEAAGGEPLRPHGKGWMLESDSPLELLSRLSAELNARQVPIQALELMRPSLESVFLRLTGTTLRD